MEEEQDTSQPEIIIFKPTPPTNRVGLRSLIGGQNNTLSNSTSHSFLVEKSKRV